MYLTHSGSTLQAASATADSVRADSQHLPATESAWKGADIRPVLGALKSPSVNVVPLKRRLPPGVERELRDWARREGAQWEHVLQPPDYRVALHEGRLTERVSVWLHADIFGLISFFATVSGGSAIRFLFGKIESDRCRKFHMDYVDYRLVCTYAGPGTEWLPEAAVNRAALVRPAICPTQANSQIVKEPEAVRHATAGEVLLMKGATHPDGPGLVHRSPPISGSATPRVVLILSTVDQAG